MISWYGTAWLFIDHDNETKQNVIWTLKAINSGKELKKIFLKLSNQKLIILPKTQIRNIWPFV